MGAHPDDATAAELVAAMETAIDPPDGLRTLAVGDTGLEPMTSTV